MRSGWQDITLSTIHLILLLPLSFAPTQRSKNYGRKYFCLFIVGAKGDFLFSIHDFESLSSGQLAAIDTIDRLFASKIRIQQSAF